MGILKHAILPLYSVALLVLGYVWLIKEDTSEFMVNWAGGSDNRDFDKTPVTQLELHLVHAVGGTAIALGINCVMAIFKENSHYRGMAVTLVMIFFGADLYSYARLGQPIPGILYGILGLGAVGLAIHAMEPGIFTKDKNSKTKSK
ncbi:MAG: hypothetical protein SGILL_010824 [Bacillariaceae sp.]